MARPATTSRESIDSVALDLFLARGFTGVTSAELAAACGVSRPTLFRHAPRMSDIVLDQVGAFGALTVERLRRHPGDPWQALSGSLVDAYRGLEPGSVMAKAFQVLTREPDLRGQSGLLVRGWRGGLAVALADRGVDGRVQCQALAGSAIGIITAAFAEAWDADTLERAFEACAPTGLAETKNPG